MPNLSLTDFVEVVAKAGTPKLTKIRQVKNRPPYSPATDFWRPLRARIIEAHQSRQGRPHIRGALVGLQDRKKLTAYPPVVEAYLRWWGRKRCEWFEPPTNVWQSGTVRVSVNPELGLEIDGERFVVKLYFKAERLAKNRVDVILHLMDEALAADEPDATMAVHDVPAGRLILPSGPVAGIGAMLRGEAAYIAAVWDEL